MAYNKITSHFSSSQTFSNTNLFIYDSNAEELKTTQFYLEDESSSNTITASNNTLIITGTIDVQNDITASDIIFDGLDIDKGIRFGETDNYIRKVDGQISIESPLGFNLEKNLKLRNSNVKSGITGSYIHTHGGKLLTAGNNIVVNEETLPSGKIRWKIAQGGGNTSNCGKTTLYFDPTNADPASSRWQLLTGSDSNEINYTANISSGGVYLDYRYSSIGSSWPTSTNIRSAASPVSSARQRLQLNLNGFTDEHKEYIQSGNRHLFILHSGLTYPYYSYQKSYYDIIFSLEMDNINQEGCKYTFIFSDNLKNSDCGWKTTSSTRPLISLKYKHNTNFTDSTWDDRSVFQFSNYNYPLANFNGRTEIDLRGVSITVTKRNNKWCLIGNE